MWVDPGTNAPEANMAKESLEEMTDYDIKGDDQMDVSTLRLDEDANVDISLGNLSDTQVVEEFPETEAENTERIIEAMGNEPGVFELCDEIEDFLADSEASRPRPSSTSTPRAAGIIPSPPSRLSGVSTSSSSPAYSSRTSSEYIAHLQSTAACLP